jgi:diketogulonate reductase-like aldo/keto reductase
MLHITLQGTPIPTLGLGTWDLRGAAAERAVASALEIGYRHIDTAQSYDNEGQVGRALAASGVARDEIFLVTKVRPSNFGAADAVASTRESLRLLQSDYVDLLLLHWPNPQVPVAETLGALSTLVDEGAVRHLGVSNFPTALMREALPHAPLLANQVEYHPYLAQSALLAQAREEDYLLTAYSPIAKGRVMDDPTLQAIGADHGKSPVQVTLRWLVQQPNVAAVPKSANPERQASNLDIFDFALSDDEMARIGALARGERIVDFGGGPDWD